MRTPLDACWYLVELPGSGEFIQMKNCAVNKHTGLPQASIVDPQAMQRITKDKCGKTARYAASPNSDTAFL
jgi:hypothetical protein